ncbi:hypothetical protein [Halococcus hamelinensis]|uniref:hypothetical protein n=1 Tax=Halococcus hamelinensis TaxID=332168 RepID=UPI000B30D406|nr:hypothetical protein [Halococcus hamelinensis]
MVYLLGNEFSGATFEAALVIAIPVADEVWNRIFGSKWAGDDKTPAVFGPSARARRTSR